MPVDLYSIQAVPMNPWEYNALQYNFPDDGAAVQPVQNDPVSESIHYPGIYAPSGFDMMNILSRVAMRPSPSIDLGPVDASCALVVCDLAQPDCPVVYANEACAQLTGYTAPEMLGRNCRFMQAPPGVSVSSSSSSSSSSSRRQQRGGAASVPSSAVDGTTLRRMRRAVETRAEIAVEVTNFKKSGEQFTNMLTMIPICWDTPTPRYYVGFMAEKTW